MEHVGENVDRLPELVTRWEYLYFDTLGEDPAFYRVRISTGKLEQVASLKGSRREWGRAEPWTGLAPDDSLLVQRDTSIQEIYGLEWTLP